MTYGDLYEYILKKEGDGIDFQFLYGGESYSYVGYDEIFLRMEDRLNPDAEAVFTMLHEIGHIRTNTEDMMRCDMEYLATKFAIKKSKEYGFRIPSIRKIEYQRYIDSWVEKDSKEYRVALNKGKYMLCW